MAPLSAGTATYMNITPRVLLVRTSEPVFATQRCREFRTFGVIFHRVRVRLGIANNPARSIDKRQTGAGFMRKPLKFRSLQTTDRQQRKDAVFSSSSR